MFEAVFKIYRLGVEDGSEDTDEQEQPLVRVRHTEEQQNINNHVDNVFLFLLFQFVTL